MSVSWLQSNNLFGKVEDGKVNYLLSFFLDEWARGKDRFRDLGSEKLLGRMETFAGKEKLRGIIERWSNYIDLLDTIKYKMPVLYLGVFSTVRS